MHRFALAPCRAQKRPDENRRLGDLISRSGGSEQNPLVRKTTVLSPSVYLDGFVGFEGFIVPRRASQCFTQRIGYIPSTTPPAVLELVGFVGFGGFTDRRSIGQSFVQCAGVLPAETQPSSNLRHPEMPSTKSPNRSAHGGFVGFEGFTDRRSASKCFAKGTGLCPAGTHTNSNLKYPKRTTYKAYKLVFSGGFVGS